MRRTRKTITGLAISTLLLAVLLLGALAVAIAIGVRSGNAHSSEHTDRTLASAIIDQGNALQRGFDEVKFDPQGVENCYVMLWNVNDGPYYGLYNPANAAYVPQPYPPAAAMNDPTQSWQESWTLCWGYINEPGVGHPDDTYADFGLILPDIKQGVCRQINQVLYGSTSVSTSPEDFSTWINDPAQSVLHPGNSNQPEACFQTSDGHFIYYHIVDTRIPGDPDGI